MSLDFASLPARPQASASSSDGCPPDRAPRDILSSIGETVYDWDLLSDRITWGPNVHEILALANPDDLLFGRSYAGLTSWESSATRLEAINSVVESDTGAGARYHAEYGLLLDPGSRNSARLWVEDSGRCFAGPDGKPVRAHGAIRIVPQDASVTQGAPARAQLDPLTGALSRSELTTCVNRLFAEASAARQSFGMLLFAIDDLAKINRKHGYETGDALIAAAAQKIRERMRGTDIIARFSGNRIAILLQNCDADQIEFAAARFMSAMIADPLPAKSGAYQLSVRSGGVCAPRDARNTQQLFQHAEEAIDAARERSAKFVPYAPSLAVDYERLRNQAISEHIIDALNQRRVTIALQPIIASRSGKPVFYEALLRLRTDDGRDMSPASIIPVAEKTGLISLLDQRVMELAIDHLAANPSQTLSVNVSGISAHNPDWLAAARTRLALYPGVASRLIAEITETCAIGDVEIMRDIIWQIRETGMRVAMDDFGAGYSSFKNLRGLGIDLLKIDGAFIQNLARSPDDRFFVRTLVDLANHLQIPVVAEWVENQETATLLAEWGVDYCQGSWFGMGDCTPAAQDTVSAEAAA